MTIARVGLALASARNSATRLEVKAGGTRRTNCSIQRPTPVQAPSHSPATLNTMTNQPRPRRGRISRAPTSTSNRKGTGGKNSAVRIGFQVSMPSIANRLFKFMSLGWMSMRTARDCARGSRRRWAAPERRTSDFIHFGTG